MCVASVGTSVNFLLVLSEVGQRRWIGPQLGFGQIIGQGVRVLDRSRNDTKPAAQAVDKGSFLSIKDCEGWTDA